MEGRTWLHVAMRSRTFLQTDPVPGGSANNYDYCNADPINCYDLAGTWPHWLKTALKITLWP